ncbi:hypothetical protein ACGFKX_20755 [Pseudonocardia alni]|uniref:hypothetical protein n=1 Tax=Pseudonocardia alni TaxID=33907 RepID=UPI000C2C9F15
MNHPVLGTLAAVPALDRPDLLAEPVVAALAGLDAGRVAVAEIDPDLADAAPPTGRSGCRPGGAGADAVVVRSGARAGKPADPSVEVQPPGSSRNWLLDRTASSRRS